MLTARQFLRQPLLHFMAIGLVIFAVFGLRNDISKPVQNKVIVVTAATAARLAAGFEATWRRPPTDVEIAGLMENHVCEEVLVREALALGLDRGDAAIRRRLRQKMEFLTTAAVSAVNLSEEMLRKHYTAYQDKFSIRGRLAFPQVFLGPAPQDQMVQKIRAG